VLVDEYADAVESLWGFDRVGFFCFDAAVKDMSESK
jgi:hypothetical protein